MLESRARTHVAKTYANNQSTSWDATVLKPVHEFLGLQDHDFCMAVQARIQQGDMGTGDAIEYDGA